MLIKTSMDGPPPPSYTDVGHSSPKAEAVSGPGPAMPAVISMPGPPPQGPLPTTPAASPRERELPTQPSIDQNQNQNQSRQHPYPPQPQMNAGGLGGGHRNVAGKPYDWRGERQWTNDLMDFRPECETCCEACWCPCVTYGRNRSRRLALERTGAPHPEGGYSCGGDCALFGFVQSLTGYGWVLEVFERGNTRQRYSIGGNQCSDCYTTFCCLACVLTQESREIEGEERSFAAMQAIEPFPLGSSQGANQEGPKT